MIIVTLNIRTEFELPGYIPGKCGSVTIAFSGWTELEIRNMIKLSPAMSCELDSIPTWLLKECITKLVPTITGIVNMSLRDSLIPK